LNTDMRKFESSQKMKAEPSWLIPLKPINNVELFIGYRVTKYENIFQTYAFISCVSPQAYLWCVTNVVHSV